MSSSTLMQCHRQWATRPDDERYLDLTSMLADALYLQGISRSTTLPATQLRAREAPGNEIVLYNPKRENSAPHNPNHWSFSQLCTRIKAPADYLRRLPASLAAENINAGLSSLGEHRLGVYASVDRSDAANPVRTIRAVTGPDYGRVPNADIIQALMDRFGDGMSGDFRVPGIFGRKLTFNTIQDTTLFMGDRDMFVFLADEERRIELPNRRNGRKGSLARGIMVGHSEVGAQTIWIAAFLFDYVCANRIVWGVEAFRELKVRHTAAAPDRFMAEVLPLVREIGTAPAAPMETRLRAAQAKRIGDGRREDALRFLTNQFGAKTGAQMMASHDREEGRPVETLWDAATAATAYAKSISHQDSRVTIEVKAGKILDMAN